MEHLTLVGLSEDKTRLLLVNDAGEQFTLAVDAKLRAALRGEHARLGQLETQMDSALRPRDIQARIRHGETPEEVAEAAHTTVDKIMAFANPVLAERAHVASRAQRSSVRRKAADGGITHAARTLGDAVAATMRSVNTDPETVVWDAWRREDGRWVLTGEYSAGSRNGVAHFSFDVPGNFVTADNDEARWLIGEAIEGAPPARDDLEQARQRKRTAPEARAEELPLGDDALSLVNEAADPDTETTADLTADLRPTEAPTETPTEPVADSTETTPEPEEDPALSPTPEPFIEEPRASAPKPPVAEPKQPPAKPARPARKKGRASVPSWDEIMFGGGKQD
jgi:hypothetical protein